MNKMESFPQPYNSPALENRGLTPSTPQGIQPYENKGIQPVNQAVLPFENQQVSDSARNASDLELSPAQSYDPEVLSSKENKENLEREYTKASPERYKAIAKNEDAIYHKYRAFLIEQGHSIAVLAKLWKYYQKYVDEIRKGNIGNIVPYTGFMSEMGILQEETPIWITTYKIPTVEIYEAPVILMEKEKKPKPRFAFNLGPEDISTRPTKQREYTNTKQETGTFNQEKTQEGYSNKETVIQKNEVIDMTERTPNEELGLYEYADVTDYPEEQNGQTVSESIPAQAQLAQPDLEPLPQASSDAFSARMGNTATPMMANGVMPQSSNSATLQSSTMTSY